MRRERIVRRVSHDAGRMFALVADVERYPEFVPGCRGLRVMRRERKGEIETVIAEMRVGYRFITERFTCRVRLDRPALAIDVEFIEGPFSELANHWRFTALGENTCEIAFEIEFELSSRRLGQIVAALFDRVFLRFVDAFERRADEVFTRRRPALSSPVQA